MVLLALNLFVGGTPIALSGLVKLLTWGRARRSVILAMAWWAEQWVGRNNAILDALLSTRYVVTGIDEEEGTGRLRRGGRYLILCNHISWIDIFLVFRVFHDRTAFIRFFMKRELIWFPIAGQGCWALEFPFMKRYSRAYLEKHPEKRGQDLETTRIACLRYKSIPVTILNFCEGTRFTRKKRDAQGSPYRNLLRPRTGGVGFVLASLGDQLDGVIDVTLAYPSTETTILDYLSNRVETIHVHAKRLDVPKEFFGADVTRQTAVRARLTDWLGAIWQEKDERIERMRGGGQEEDLPPASSAISA